VTRLANEKILEVENLLQSLTNEMLKLKSATKNYEETKENLQNMCESIDKISMTHQKLTNNMSQFLAEIEKMNYRELTDKILEQGESQSKALSDEFRKQTDRILQNNESQSRALDDLLQHNKNQSKALRLVKYLIVLGVLMEAIVIIRMLFFS
jgi:sugar-specific transcriptional regulator TrmB